MEKDAGDAAKADAAAAAVADSTTAASTASAASTDAATAASAAAASAASAFNAAEIDNYLRGVYTRFASDSVIYTPLESTSQWKTKVDRRASIKEKNGARNVIRHDRLQVDILFELNRLVYQQQRRK